MDDQGENSVPTRSSANSETAEDALNTLMLDIYELRARANALRCRICGDAPEEYPDCEASDAPDGILPQMRASIYAGGVAIGSVHNALLTIERQFGL